MSEQELTNRAAALSAEYQSDQRALAEYQERMDKRKTVSGNDAKWQPSLICERSYHGLQLILAVCACVRVCVCVVQSMMSSQLNRVQQHWLQQQKNAEQAKSVAHRTALHWRAQR